MIEDQWRLYNLVSDPGEQIDLANVEPEILKNLVEQWENYAKETGMIVPDYNVDYAQ